MSARETARGRILVRRAAKDGAQGIPGLIYRTSRWEMGKEYRNDTDITSTTDGFRYVDVVTDVDMAVVGVNTFNAYICKRTHTSSVSNPLMEGANWTKINSLRPIATSLILASKILADYINVENLAANNAFLTALTAESAFINKLVANTAFLQDLAAASAFINALTVKSLQTDSGKVTIDNNGSITAIDANITGTINANSGIFKGTLEAVQGTFKSLRCIDTQGNEQGEITFGSNGTLIFEGDLYSQGYNSTNRRGYLFYAANIWCRGQFGANARTAIIVDGANAYVYYKGLGDITGQGDTPCYDYISLQSSITSSGTTYYTIPTYSPSTNSSGMPIDVVIFKRSNYASNIYYDFAAILGKKFTAINANNNDVNVFFAVDGNWTRLTGGESKQLFSVGRSNKYPAVASNVLGGDLMILSSYDQNWP